jgi:hypothetical protein
VVDAFAAENAVTNSVLYSSDVGTVVATDSQVGELTEGKQSAADHIAKYSSFTNTT